MYADALFDIKLASFSLTNNTSYCVLLRSEFEVIGQSMRKLPPPRASLAVTEPHETDSDPAPEPATAAKVASTGKTFLYA